MIEILQWNIRFKICKKYYWNLKYTDSLSDNISALIKTEDFREKIKDKYSEIVLNNPRTDYFKLHNILSNRDNYNRKQLNITIWEDFRKFWYKPW